MQTVTVTDTYTNRKSRGTHGSQYAVFRLNENSSKPKANFWVEATVNVQTSTVTPPLVHRFANDSSSRGPRNVSPRVSNAPSKSKSRSNSPPEPKTPSPPPSHQVPAHAIVGHPYTRSHTHAPPRRPTNSQGGDSYDMFLASYHQSVDGMTAGWS